MKKNKIIFILFLFLILKYGTSWGSSTLIPRKNSNNLIGYTNTEGEVKIPFEYDDGGYFKNGLAIIGKNGLYGIIDSNGVIVLPIEYFKIKILSKTIVCGIKKTNTWETYLLPNRYIGSYNHYYPPNFNEEGLLIIKNSDSLTIINNQNKFVLPVGSYNLKQIDKYFIYYFKGLAGVSTKNGPLIEPIYDEIRTFEAKVNSSFHHQTFFETNRKGLWGLTSEYTKIPNEYDQIFRLNDNVLLFKGSKKTTLVNIFNNLILTEEPSYSYYQLDRNLIGFKESSKNHGIIDSDKLRIIASGFDSIYFDNSNSGFGAGILHYKKDKIEGLINDNGEMYPIPTYDSISNLNPMGYYIICKNRKVGLIDEWGKKIIEIDHDSITFNIKKDKIILWQKGKCGVFDNTKKVLQFNCIYDSIQFIGNKGDSIAVTYINNKKKIILVKTVEFNVKSVYKNNNNLRLNSDYFKVFNNWYYYRKKREYHLLKNNQRLVMKSIESLDHQLTKTIRLKGDDHISANDYYFDYNPNITNQTSLFGIYNETTEKFIVPTQYINIRQIGKLFICTNESHQSEIRDFSGKVILDDIAFVGNEYENLMRFNRGGSFIKNSKNYLSEESFTGGLWGFINRDGQIICKPKYTSASDFKKNCSIVSSNGKYGLISLNFDTLIPLKFDYIIETDSSYSNFFTGVTNQKIGFFCGDKSHIPFIYKKVWSFIKDKAIVSENKLLNCINKDGVSILSNEYAKLSILESGDISYLENGKWGLIDNLGKVKLPANFQSIYSPKDTIIRIKKDNLYGFISTNNKWILPAKYKDATDFVHGQSVIRDENLYGTIDLKGHKIIDSKFQSLTPLVNSTNYIFNEKGMYGIIDCKGKIIVSNIYNKLSESNNGEVSFMKNKSSGILFENGNIKFELPFKRSYQLTNTLFKINLNEKYFFVDTSGTALSNEKYDWIGKNNNNYFIVKEKEYSSLINPSSKVLMKIKGELFEIDDSYFFITKTSSGYNVIDTNGIYLFDTSMTYLPISLYGKYFALKKNKSLLPQYSITNPYTEQSRLEYIFREIGPNKEGCSYAQLNYLLGLVSRNGSKLLENEFYSLKKIDENIFEIIDEKRKGYLVQIKREMKFISYEY